MTDPNPFMDGDKFPDRPDHPDFWRLSDVILQLDGHVQDPRLQAARQMANKPGKDVVNELFDRVVDAQSLAYLVQQRILRALELQKAGLLGDDNLYDLLRSLYIEGFMVGHHYTEKGGHRER